jgi:hypothetical protein
MSNDTVLGLLLIALSVSLGRSAVRAATAAIDRVQSTTGSIGAMALALYEVGGGAATGPMILFWIGILFTVSGAAISFGDLAWRLMRRASGREHRSRTP